MAEYCRQCFFDEQLVFVYLRDDPYQYKIYVVGVPGLSDTHHTAGFFYFTRKIAHTSVAGCRHEHDRMSVIGFW